MVLQHAILAFSIAAILSPFSYYAGLGARALRLPQITGYLLSGIICGPYVLGILNTESVADLNIIESACLSIIGLAAGAELDLPSLSRSRKQVLGITAGVCIITWILCYETINWAGQMFTILPTTSDASHRTAVATLGATLMMTRSPASAIAVLKEVDGKGPFSSLVMAVVVVKDVVVIMAYALNMELIRAVVLPANAKGGLQLLNILLPFLSVLLSMALGVFGGILLGMLLRVRGLQMLPTSHQPGAEINLGAPSPRRPRVGTAWIGSPGYKMTAVVVVSSIVFQFAHHFDAEPLLACVTMGMVMANRRGESREKDKEELLSLVTQIMSVSNVAFFGLAGASLKLSAIRSMLVPGLLVMLVRVLAIYLGSWLGCKATGTQPDHGRVFWASMVTQAGVALGLARLVGTRFPDWGPHFQTYMVAIILINLLVGPPLFRWSLIRVGEARVAANKDIGGIGTRSHGGTAMNTVLAVAKSLDLDQLAIDLQPTETKVNHAQ